jgi:hypothetical protein
VLLDQLLTVKELEQVYCCNELNCGYSAEGYARACGAAAAEGEAATQWRSTCLAQSYLGIRSKQRKMPRISNQVRALFQGAVFECKGYYGDCRGRWTFFRPPI